MADECETCAARRVVTIRNGRGVCGPCADIYDKENRDGSNEAG